MEKKRWIISNKLFILILFFLSIITIETFIIFKYVKYTEFLKDTLISIIPGEKISYFELIGNQGEEVNISTLINDNVKLLYIFEQPCAPCNKNIVFWKRLAKLFEDRISIYGIIIDESKNAFSFTDKKKFNFDIYVPKDKKKFIDAFRLKTKWAQTILYSNKVHCLRLGDLDFEDFVNFNKNIKKLIDKK